LGLAITCTNSMLRFSFFFSSRRRHTRCYRDWSSDVCSSDLYNTPIIIRSLCHRQSCSTKKKQISANASACFVRSRDGRNRSLPRSEERRVGKEGRARWSRGHGKKNERESGERRARTS